jgi:hypothetical protein
MKITLAQVKQRMERAFSPDMSCIYQGKSIWTFKPITSLGKEWCRQYKGVIMSQFLVSRSIFDEVYQSMLNDGLTVETQEEE